MQFENVSPDVISQRIEFFILLHKIRATFLAIYYYFFVQIIFDEENLKNYIGENKHTTTVLNKKVDSNIYNSLF